MDIPKLVESLGGFAWPLIAAIVLWKIFPQIRDVLKSRGFKIKIGEMEVSVQDASEQLRTLIEDLQKKVAELRLHTQGAVGAFRPVQPTIMPPAAPRKILWVDDNPSNNAYEIARLRDDGVEVTEVTSTDEALRLLVTQHISFRAIISDLDRREEGVYRPKAGISLIEQVRSAGITTPIFIYTTARALERTREEVQSIGGTGATASSVELFEMLRELTL